MIYAIRLVSAASWGGLYPFMALWLTMTVGVNAKSTAVVVGFAVVANRVGAFLLYPIMNRVDQKIEIIACHVVILSSSLAMCLMAKDGLSSAFFWVIVVSLLGVANSACSICQISYIVQSCEVRKHEKALSFENVALNLGGGASPLIASLLISSAGVYFPLISAFFAAIGTSLAVLLPKTSSDGTERASILGDGQPSYSAGAIKRLSFLTINFFTMIGYSQLYYVFPTYAAGYMPTSLVGEALLIGAIVVVFGQIPITHLFRRVYENTRTLMANICIGISCIGLALCSGSVYLLYLSAFLVVIGEMLCGPLYQAQAIKIWGGRNSRAMSIQTLVWGAAESLATVLGLLAVSMGHGNYSFFLGAFACGAVALFALIAAIIRSPIIGFPVDISAKWAKGH